MGSLVPEPIPYGAAPPGSNCVIHKNHSPLVTYCELHHVVPQDWQATWSPPNFTHQPNDPNWPHSGLSPDRPGLYLWDARTDALCRTGHGNVHFYLVKLMHWMSERPNNIQDAIAYAQTQLRLTFRHQDPHAVAEALLGIERFQQAGGSFSALWAAHSWGQI